jgi:hypothetical protein
MVDGGWGAGWRHVVMVAAILCGACGSSGSMCPLPMPETPQGTLTLREKHEFGSDYDVLSATYLVDGCVFQQSDDTAFLKKPLVEFAPKALPAGTREVRYVVKFRSGFSADMHRYEWMMSGGAPLDVVEGGQNILTLRMFEREDADPRARMTITMEHESTKP